METILTFNSKNFELHRYPKTEDKSLRAWSNAEIFAANHIVEHNKSNIHLFNDRFGVWNCLLQNKRTTTVWLYASQQKAIFQNLKKNDFSTEIELKSPLDDLKKVELALVKLPKSLDLFELFLTQIHKASNTKTEVICCFMTKYFSASYLTIASKYFDIVEQTKAWKKARLLILKEPKKDIQYKDCKHSISWKKTFLEQYYGVFSAEKIDIGTQFLLNNIKIKPKEKEILDVASGNGIITYELAEQKNDAKFTVVDDFYLAVASSEINLKKHLVNYICDDNLNQIAQQHFDLVVSNPPFHFEHENNIEVSLSLFHQIKNCLKKSGRFVLVANRHLNYKTHLEKIFNTVFILSENNKFVVYECKNHL